MDILTGVGILAATALLFCWAYGAHLRPDRRAWTDMPGLSMLVCVAFTVAMPLGIGFVLRGAIDPLADIARATPLAAMVSLGLVALAGLAAPRLVRPALRSRATPMPANLNDAPATRDLPRAA